MLLCDRLTTDKQKLRKICGWGYFSKYRRELFGLAICSIIVFHYCLDLEKYCDGFAYKIGKTYTGIISSGGVDLFVFLSGIGLYYSLSKNSIQRFYLNRIRRICISYIIVGLAYYVISCEIMSICSWSYGIKDFLLLSYWAGNNSGFWYVSFIIPCYIIYPLFYELDKLNNRLLRRFVKGSVFLVSLICIICVSKCVPEWYETTELALCRIPIFILGCFVARLVFENHQIKNSWIIYLGCFFRVIVLVSKSLGWSISEYFEIIYPYNRWIIGWSTVGILILASQLISESSFLDNLFKKIGDISFELYITHISMWNLLHGTEFYSGQLYLYLIIIISSVLLSLVLKKILGKIWCSRKSYLNA